MSDRDYSQERVITSRYVSDRDYSQERVITSRYVSETTARRGLLQVGMCQTDYSQERVITSRYVSDRLQPGEGYYK